MKQPILALIPARSGSKSIRDKNIRSMAGKPMLAYSIEQARNCPLIDRIVLSTDSEQYAKIALEYGAEVPFLRPPEISGDMSTDLEAFQHALSWLKQKQGYEPEMVVHLRPTHPIRSEKDLTRCIEILRDDPTLDSVRSIVSSPDTPYKMWNLDAQNRLSPVLPADMPEAFNMPRQKLPEVFLQNGCIDVVRTSVIVEGDSMTGKNIYGYEMDYNFDIDTERHFRRAEEELILHNLFHDDAPKTICFDIDGVIASIVDDLRYDRAEPIPQMVKLINRLFDHGHRIVLFTARGSGTGIDWKQVTEQQMEKWGVRHHELRFGKPPADYYVDDKMLSLFTLFCFLD